MISQLKSTDLKNLLKLIDPLIRPERFVVEWIRILASGKTPAFADTHLSSFRVSLWEIRSSRKDWSERQYRLFDWIYNHPINITELIIASLPRRHPLNAQVVDNETWETPTTCVSHDTSVRLKDGTVITVAELVALAEPKRIMTFDPETFESYLVSLDSIGL